MSTEKTPALYIPQDSFDEKDSKNKYCSKSFITWVLSALLIALLVALCIQFLFPVVERKYNSDVDVVKIYDGTPIEVRFRSHSDTGDTLTEKGVDEPWHLDFLINPTRLCDTLESPDTEAYRKDPEVQLLMLVPSSTDHFAQRKAIRKTWGSIADKPHGPMRLGFVLGKTSNATEEGLISKESEKFGDIIQADFEDTYRNLTTKSVLMLKWVAKHCPHAQYFLKTDDDTFVNLSILSEVLQKDPFAPEERFIGGFIHRGAQPSRGPDQKYFVSESDYPNEEYPPYISGSAYVTTGPTAVQLFEASKEVKPMLPMEDVFVTGLCAEEIAANLIHEPCFRYEELSQPSSFDKFSSLATIHSVSPDDMDKLWNEMTKAIYDALNFPDEHFLGSMDITTEIRSPFDLFDFWNFPRGRTQEKEQSANFYGLMDSQNSDSGPISDISSLSNWALGPLPSSEYSWMQSKSDNLNGGSRLLNLLTNSRASLSAPSLEGRETNLDLMSLRGSQDQQQNLPNWPGSQDQQQNLPNWPGSPMNSAPLSESKFQLPMTWQKTFIIPLPLNRLGGNGFNLTEFLLE